MFKVKSQIAVLTHSKMDRLVVPLLRQLSPMLDLSFSRGLRFLPIRTVDLHRTRRPEGAREAEGFSRPASTVKKTLKGWESEHKEWQERIFEVQETLKQFPQTELQQCLADQYGAIMNVDMVRITSRQTISIEQLVLSPTKAMPLKLGSLT